MGGSIDCEVAAACVLAFESGKRGMSMADLPRLPLAWKAVLTPAAHLSRAMRAGFHNGQFMKWLGPSAIVLREKNPETLSSGRGEIHLLIDGG